MIRIMGWNIERFGVNKLLNNAWDIAGMRREYIMSSIQQADPDIFVIIEVQTNAAAEFGGLISDTSGAPGVQAILWQLRQDFPADQWCVVPPLIVTPYGGYSEGMAVFFKASRLNFWGPWMWTGVAAVPFANVGSQSYAGTVWDGALPATPSTMPGGNNIPQDHLAGQYAFFNNLGERILFPYGAARSIWYTDFEVLDSERRLSIFSVHLPPDAVQARRAVRRLATVPEITSPMLVMTDRVIIGDFNINALDPAQADVYQHLTGGPSVMPVAPVSPIVYQQMIHEPTALVAVTAATTDGPADYFGYGARNGAGVLKSLDNIFVARTYDGDPPQNATVVNRVIGTPVVPPQQYTMAMVDSIPDINFNLVPGPFRNAHFQNLFNYGHIGKGRGASDHMAVVVDLP